MLFDGIQKPSSLFLEQEFLWNEMHTAFATEEEALEHGKKVMEAYEKITKDLMALPEFTEEKPTMKNSRGQFSQKKCITIFQTAES
jgi:prolyl-tRNA synthetase